jgi:hypothetical protein
VDLPPEMVATLAAFAPLFSDRAWIKAQTLAIEADQLAVRLPTTRHALGLLGRWPPVLPSAGAGISRGASQGIPRTIGGPIRRVSGTGRRCQRRMSHRYFAFSGRISDTLPARR